MSRLVVVSNRIAPPDEHAASAGGLAVGILGALKAAGGLWFGWSGETGNEDQPLKKVKKGNITWASFNLSEQDLDEYYNQFSSRSTEKIFCTFFSSALSCASFGGSGPAACLAISFGSMPIG